MPELQNFTGDIKHYIAPFEVVVHNTEDDCWVSFLGRVLDITPLIKEFKGQKCVKPLIAFAGKDVSIWFDEHTNDIRHYVHPITGVRVPYCPHGSLPHVWSQVPSCNWKKAEMPWWNDPKYQVGLLTKRVRPVRILNMLIFKEATLSVCCEDTIRRIAERYSIFNSDALSYTWRFGDTTLDLDKNLDENGVPDERDAFTDLGLPQSLHVPCLFLYYNDDLKWEYQEWITCDCDPCICRDCNMIKQV